MAAATLDIRGPFETGLSVPAGGVLAVLGAAGSGKTALMRLLAGFRRARAGEILLDGRSIGSLAPHRRGFGVVQQRDALLPGRTLEENIALPLALRRVRGSARQRLVQAAMELVVLPPGSGSTMPRSATPLERRLALLARAVVFAPPLLLLDDPAGGLDEDASEVVMSAVRRARRMLGATMVLATPRPGEALATGEQVAVLDGGRLLRVAAPRELYERPLSAGEASILGRPNLLRATVLTVEDDIATVSLACGPTVDAQPASSLSAGQSCVLAIDPWRIAVAPVSAADMGERALDATLLEAVFQGESTRLSLLLGSGAELVVMRPSAAGLRGLTARRRIAIAWEPHHAMVFPARG